MLFTLTYLITSLIVALLPPVALSPKRLVECIEQHAEDSAYVRGYFAAAGFAEMPGHSAPADGMIMENGEDQLVWRRQVWKSDSDKTYRCIGFSSPDPQKTAAFLDALEQRGYAVLPGSCSRYTVYHKGNVSAGVSGTGTTGVFLFTD